jgi:glycosyltransferase involved in cell wall biosynthesis
MKIAVYTIALNEEQFVERWYESAKGADYLLIADTGSTDNTVAKAEALGIKVVSIHVKPWRFDVARNTSLALLPADIDYCIQLDMDEVLVGDWRSELEKAHQDGVTNPRYDYSFSPDVKFPGFKVHTRDNIVWRYPIHEAPYAYGDVVEKHQHYNFAIDHYPDPNKSRGQYLPMLEEAVKEYPGDARMEYYLGREYYYYKKWDGAFKHLTNAIKKNWWQQLETYDMAAMAAYHLGYKDKAIEYGLKAYNLNPSDERLKNNLTWYEGMVDGNIR